MAQCSDPVVKLRRLCESDLCGHTTAAPISVMFDLKRIGHVHHARAIADGAELYRFIRFDDVLVVTSAAAVAVANFYQVQRRLI